MVRSRRLTTILFSMFCFCGIAISAAPASRAAALTTTRVASALPYPIYVTAPPGDDRLFIIEQAGVIKILKNGSVLATPFLDINALVPDIGGNDERGLLGLAFHPDYATNGTFYINYINLSNNTVIARYHVSANPDVADPTSAFTIMTIVQPYQNHNGGTLLFGPNDGYLYIGMGDGGDAGDPGNRAQDPGSLLGKMLRIDVDHGSPYSIPPDNPFAGPGLPLDEIWDFGLRNPYRWSFDRQTADLYIGDVGQNLWEEIDFEAAHSGGGFNYGWRRMEGTHCYNPPTDCYDSTLTLPIYEYSHSGTPARCSVTGGNVYRGSIPDLRGTYFFADFCSSNIWTFRYVDGAVTDFRDRTAELAPGGGLSIGSIAAFGEDGAGELYIVDRGTGSNGEIYKIGLNPADVGPGDPGSGSASAALDLGTAVPNPSTGAVRWSLGAGRETRVRAEIVDAAGRIVRDLGEVPVASGRTDIVWDGRDAGRRNAASGIYFLQVRGEEGRSVVRRLQIIR